jgi:hypothetical protein
MIFNHQLERIAKCIGPACIAAVVIAAISLWVGKPSIVASIAIIAVGAGIGAIWAAKAKRPALCSATYVDDRLKLKDLLATAWALRNSNNPWEQSIVAQAEAACRAIRSADALPPMTGGRVWSAIGLGTALAISLGMIAPMTKQSSQVAGGFDTLATDSAIVPNVVASQMQQSRPAGDGSLNEISDRPSGDSPAADDEKTASSNSPANGSTSGNSSGTGAGIGHTTMPIQLTQTPQRSDGASIHSSKGTPSGGTPSGGSGTASSLSGTPAPVQFGTSSPTTTTVTPPWQTPAWPAAQSSALQSVQSGSIDPAYQSIVRDYFNRP